MSSPKPQPIYRLFSLHVSSPTPADSKLLHLENADSISRDPGFRPLRDGLGFAGAVFLFGGSIILLCVLALLLFLWLGEGASDGQNASVLWRWIVLRQFLTQTVTLSSVVLRVVTASQAAVCTSLLAAMVLESYGIPLSLVAEVSVMRGVNDGPMKLASLLLHKARRCALPTTMACLLLLASVAIQFSSTLLISDLVNKAVVGDPTYDMRPVFMSTATLKQTVNTNYWLQKPSAYMAFGEIASGTSSSPSGAGVSDTGITKRVFLPFQEGQRKTTRRYEGKGFTFHTRHVCLPPVMDASLYILAEPQNPNNPANIILAGNMSYAASLRMAGLPAPPDCPDGSCFSDQPLGAFFNCSLPSFQEATDKAAYGEYVSMVCILEGINAIDADNKTQLTDQLVTSDSEVFLVARNNGSYDQSWTAAVNGTTVGTNLTFDLTSQLLPTRNGEWSSIVLPNDVHFDFSLCFQQLAVDLSDVQVSASRDLPDATLSWNSTTNSFDTTQVRSLMGTLNSTANSSSSRGTYAVDSVRNATTSFNTQRYYRMLMADPWELPSVTYINPNPFLTPVAVGFELFNPQTEFQALFADTLRTTDRPALALQTVMTAMTSSVLNDFIVQYNVPENVTLVSSVAVPVPGQCRGLTAVFGIVALHMLAAGATTGMFLLRARYSAQGNYWHALAQVVSDETMLLVKHSTVSNDREVGVLLRAGDPEVRIARSAETGRVQVVRASRVDAYL